MRRSPLIHALVAAVFAIFLCGPAVADEAASKDLARAVELAGAGDAAGALEIIVPLAERGNPQAQHYMGKLLSAGQGVAQDHAAAFEWYSRAADQGFREAQFSLGLAYGGGFGVKQDNLQALKWFIIAETEDGLAFDMLSKQVGPRATEQARAMAQAWLGDRDRSRLQTALRADNATKVAMLTELADGGMAAAQYELGMLYSIGLPHALASTKKSTVPGLLDLQPDHETARDLFLRAAQQGYAPAQRAYADRLGDDPAAVEWYRKAAEQGDANARYSLAARYASGTGIQKDSAEAIRLYRLAAGGEHTYAMIALGDAYYDGNDVPQDLERAYMWLALARTFAEDEFNAVAVRDVDRKLESVSRLLSSRKIDSAKEAAEACRRTKLQTCGD